MTPEQETIERLKADLKLADRNAALALEDKDRDWQAKLRGMFDTAVGALDRDLEELQKNMTTENLENVVICYATLRRRIKHLAKII